MSFLDEPSDRPRRRTSRRPTAAGPAPGGPSVGTRRLVALVVGVVLIVGLVLATRGCLESRKQRSFEDYGREVTALVEESLQQSDGLFDLLQASEGQDPIELQTRVNELRVAAELLVDRAEAAGPPDEMNEAHRFLVDALDLRREGLAAVAGQIDQPSDTGQANSIAASAQHFVASDVLYRRRFVTRYESVLAEEGYLDEVGRAPRREDEEDYFTKDIGFLDPSFVEDRLAGLRRAGADPDEPATPGLHGTELVGVTAQPSGVALAPDGPTEVAATEELAFDIQVMNGGESEETSIPVMVRLSGAGEPIEVEDELETIAAGETETITVPLAAKPPTGQPVTVEVSVEPVPGEEKIDNNEGAFQVTFTG